MTLKMIESLSINTILMSPPCQPFTRVGKKGDCNDVRTKSFLHLLQILLQWVCLGLRTILKLYFSKMILMQIVVYVCSSNYFCIKIIINTHFTQKTNFKKKFLSFIQVERETPVYSCRKCQGFWNLTNTSEAGGMFGCWRLHISRVFADPVTIWDP